MKPYKNLHSRFENGVSIYYGNKYKYFKSRKKVTFYRFAYLFTRSRILGRMYLIILPTQVTDDI